MDEAVLNPQQPPVKRGRGRPRSTESRSRLQYTLPTAVYQEVERWHSHGKLATTLSKTIERMILEWLEANRPLLTVMHEASVIQDTIQKRRSRQSVHKTLQQRTINEIVKRGGMFLDPNHVTDAMNASRNAEYRENEQDND